MCHHAAGVSLFALAFSLGAVSDVRLGAPFLVRDISTAPPALTGPAPTSLTVSGNAVYFTAFDPANGNELWRSDGTSAGTQIVRDVLPGTYSSSPGWLTDVDGSLFFVPGVVGNELWKSDGAAEGTVRVKNFPSTDVLSSFVNAGGSLFFALRDYDTSLSELWKSDGTEGGTVRVASLPKGSFAGSLFWAAPRIFFSTSAGDLWSSDGTEAGTIQLRANFSLGVGIENFVAFQNAIYLRGGSAEGFGLWRSDGTVAGTVLVKSFNASASLTGLVSFNGRLYFTADSSGGTGLWKSDGTPSGTVFVNTSSVAEDGTSLVVDGNLFYISSSGEVTIWKSDGTVSGTAMVTTVPGYAGFRVGTAGGLFFFVSGNGQLWRSDGTAAGTIPLHAVAPGDGVSYPPLASLGNSLLFAGVDSASGYGLWKSDGTPAGTVLVRDNQKPASSSPADLVPFADSLYFTATDSANVRGIWKTDGSSGSTVFIKGFPIPVGYTAANFGPIFLTPVNETLFFWNLSAVPGEGGLWKSDGTSQGTVLLRSLGAFAVVMTKVGGTLFLLASDGADGIEIWKSDGTPTGTVMVKDSDPGKGSPFSFFYPKMSASSGGKYFVMGADFGVGRELLVSDGTQAGTHLVKDISPGAGDSFPEDLTDVNGTLFFFADDGLGGHGLELWKSDGTASGTVLVKDINPGAGDSVGFPSQTMMAVGNLAYFDAYDGIHGSELWRSDGTDVGTFLLKDIASGPDDAFAFPLGSLGGILFFSADDGLHGRQLWRTDGTPAGTFLLKAIEPGVDMIDAGGFLVFSASDGVHGQEVWVSDGTPTGTVRLADVSPGASSFGPSSFARSGPFVFFAGDDGQTGRELWALRVGGIDGLVPPRHLPRQIPFRPAR
jgi:ELWxxDGT repeat protein